MKFFNRTTVINYLLSRFSEPTNYLEIGVQTGYNFLKISADKKVAVDPQFKIPGGFSNNSKEVYLETTSDDYFESLNGFQDFHVVFVDGLHTYPQSHKDVINSLKHLNKKGVIVMHDCMPPNKAAAQRSNAFAKTMPGFNNIWNGDVWKTIVDLKSHKSDLNIFTVNEDFGLGIISFGENEEKLNFTKEDIEKMEYEDFDKNYPRYMNLKPKEHFMTTFK